MTSSYILQLINNTSNNTTTLLKMKQIIINIIGKTKLIRNLGKLPEFNFFLSLQCLNFNGNCSIFMEHTQSAIHTFTLKFMVIDKL